MKISTSTIANALTIYRRGGPMSLFEEIDRRLTWRRFNRRLEQETPRNRAFDLRHGTDTADEIDLTAVGLNATQARRGNQVYRVFWEENFDRLFDDLPARLHDYTFVDIGSGKGKLLLLASHRPFRKVIGIELAPALHEIAQRNIAIYESDRKVCRDVTSILDDALAFPIPDGPLVCLMVNPFDPPTIARVLVRLGQKAVTEASPVYVVYANMRRISEAGDIFDRVPGLSVIQRRRNHIVLGNKAAVAAEYGSQQTSPGGVENKRGRSGRW